MWHASHVSSRESARCSPTSRRAERTPLAMINPNRHDPLPPSLRKLCKAGLPSMHASDAARPPIRIAVMVGDGIGPEITAATLVVLREVGRRLGLGLAFEDAPIGLEALKTRGSTLPDASFATAKAA